MHSDGALDLFIGTQGVGNVTPAAAYPFGMVQAGPDTSAEPACFRVDKGHCGGYQFSDGWLWRFSQTHLSGTGCASLGDFGILPCVGDFDGDTRPAMIVKDAERAEPGFYATAIDEDGVRIGVEIAALAHVAAYRFAFSKGTANARLLLDLDWGMGNPPTTNDFWGVGGRDCWGKYVFSSSCERVADNLLAGGRKVWIWNDYAFHFALQASVPIREIRTVRDGDGVRGSVYELYLGTLSDGVVEIQIALSSTSPDAAIRNLRAELPDHSFVTALQKSREAWHDHLSRVVLSETTPVGVRANFETALYRTMVQPNDLGDCDAKSAYSTLSLWDTFRAAHPLYTILVPERVPGFVTSMLDQCDRQGYLPVWGLGGSENHCMIGHHAVPVIVDAYLKGLVPNAQEERAYRAVRQSLTVNHKAINDGTWGLLKEDWDILDRYGYYPFDALRGRYGKFIVRGESVARTFECAYDDACAARFAVALGKADEAEFFRRRSESWKRVFDATIGIARGKDASGKWRESFNPYDLGQGPWADNDFCEGGAFQYTWHVMHDPMGLVALLGGKEKAGVRLDALFSDRSPRPSDKGFSYDISGCIGQYVHGNEPSHHIIYLYAYTDRPQRLGERIAKVFETQYAPRPDGLCGNDDCGQMSAWYVFSALGFYPLDPCGGDYVLGVPQVQRATLNLSNGRTFAVAVKNFSKAQKHVRSILLNGKAVVGQKIRHADIVNGGVLEFEMAD